MIHRGHITHLSCFRESTYDPTPPHNSCLGSGSPHQNFLSLSITIIMADYSQMTVRMLQQELRRRGLLVPHCRKVELIERLQSADTVAAAATAAAVAAPTRSSTSTSRSHKRSPSCFTSSSTPKSVTHETRSLALSTRGSEPDRSTPSSKMQSKRTAPPSIDEPSVSRSKTSANITRRDIVNHAESASSSNLALEEVEDVGTNDNSVRNDVP